MKKYLIFLGIILLIAVSASYLASSHPDGLEFVAEKLGFINSAVERSSVLGDYNVYTGIIGIFLCFGLFWIIKCVMQSPEKL